MGRLKAFHPAQQLQTRLIETAVIQHYLRAPHLQEMARNLWTETGLFAPHFAHQTGNLVHPSLSPEQNDRLPPLGRSTRKER